MNKIIREHYPVSSLPRDLRIGLDPKKNVRVIIEEREPVAEQKLRLLGLMTQVRRSPPIDDDPVARIRELRDEWDD
ncbi:MAG: hypothetical protein AB7K04_02330 [Pseudorhodoplanes sp.]